MEFDEFKDLVDRHTSLVSREADWDEDSFVIENGFIVQRHKAGGAAGGNCWGDSAKHFSNNKPRSDFLPLDPILMEVSPQISYLKYREIEKLIVEDSEHDSEYYGNYTEYNIYKLSIYALYDTIFA